MERQVLQSIKKIQKEMHHVKKFKIFQVFLKVTLQLYKYAFLWHTTLKVKYNTFPNYDTYSQCFFSGGTQGYAYP
jgi:hypothetical protein